MGTMTAVEITDPTAVRDLRLRRIELAIITAMAYVVASLVLIYPVYFFASGVQAAGDAAGLWVGDANSNDGEETWALGWGLILIVAGLTIVAFVLRGIARRYSLSAIPSIVVGTLVIVVLIVTVCVGVVAIP